MSKRIDWKKVWGSQNVTTFMWVAKMPDSLKLAIQREVRRQLRAPKKGKMR